MGAPLGQSTPTAHAPALTKKAGRRSTDGRGGSEAVARLWRWYYIFYVISLIKPESHFHIFLFSFNVKNISFMCALNFPLI
jgi:hypothetical protein